MQEIEERSHEIGMDYARYTERQFNTATRAIDKKISYWYYKMADNNGVSLAAAKEMLRNDELEEFHWSVEEYIKKGESLEYDKRWENQLINASAKVHISRLEAMKLQMQQECEVLYGNLSDGLDKTMTEIYTQGYYHTAYELMRGTEIGAAFNILDTRRIEQAVNTTWANDGKNFTARCWENKNKLINELNTILTQNIIRGEAPGKAIAQLSKKMKVSRYNAGRLIMTESAFISSKCQRDCYKDLGVEKFEFVATLDSSTSEICREMDGKVFKMSDYRIGINAPPLHCFCRSCTVPYFEDDFGQVGERAAREEDGKTTYVPGNMTYEEWKEKYIDANQGNNFEEKSLRSKGGDYGVNWNVIKSKQYTERFRSLSDNQKANELVAKRSRNALAHRDGKDTEELYAINMTTGKEVSSIINQNYRFGVKRTEKFAEDIARAEKDGSNILLIHNHPRGTPPSIADINELLSHKNVSGITVGHTGSIYYYTKPNKRIKTIDLHIASKKNKGYNGIELQEKALEELAKQFGFVFRKM